MTILVTGGAGFIGSNFIRSWFNVSEEQLINLDILNYSANLKNLANVSNNKLYTFICGDIGDKHLVTRLMTDYQPRAIINFAAESHVDRSILNPEAFVNTNILGAFNLLEVARNYWQELSGSDKKKFRFLQVSTDEIYGSLAPDSAAFTEKNRINPNSPYSASKASADLLVRAWFETFKLPVLTTNCSNNYGPYQFPEKLIPLVIINAITGKKLPIYGSGMQIRDWLYVDDHCSAIRAVLENGKVGETYNVGGLNEKTNVEVVQTICGLLENLRPRGDDKSYSELIEYVADRPGHDQRYAIDATKIEKEIGWKPVFNFHEGIKVTVEWYLENSDWVSDVQSGDYQNWLDENYSRRGS